MLYVETKYDSTGNMFDDVFNYKWGAILMEQDDSGIGRVIGIFAAHDVQRLADTIKFHSVKPVDYVRDINGNITDTGCLTLAEAMELTYIEV